MERNKEKFQEEEEEDDFENRKSKKKQELNLRKLRREKDKRA